jgi:hypothetical protein
MSRIFTSKFNPSASRWEIVVDPSGNVYAFPETLPLSRRHGLESHRRYLIGTVTQHGVAWTAADPSGLVFGSTFLSRSAAIDVVADEVDLISSA